MTDLPARLVVLSPHLDDAVLSCGSVIASRPGSVVLTVFAGRPGDWSTVAGWDALCGFTSGQDVIAARRREDERALGVLGARAIWLDHLDEVYRGENDLDMEALVDDIAEHLETLDPDVVLVPLGLHHGDHVLTHAAALRAVSSRMRVVIYGDFYHLLHPEELAARVTELEETGMLLSALPAPDGFHRLKRRAIRAYRTQRRGLGRGLAGLVVRSPELLWQVG